MVKGRSVSPPKPMSISSTGGNSSGRVRSFDSRTGSITSDAVSRQIRAGNQRSFNSDDEFCYDVYCCDDNDAAAAKYLDHFDCYDDNDDDASSSQKGRRRNTKIRMEIVRSWKRFLSTTYDWFVSAMANFVYNVLSQPKLQDLICEIIVRAINAFMDQEDIGAKMDDTARRVIYDRDKARDASHALGKEVVPMVTGFVGGFASSLTPGAIKRHNRRRNNKKKGNSNDDSDDDEDKSNDELFFEPLKENDDEDGNDDDDNQDSNNNSNFLSFTKKFI